MRYMVMECHLSYAVVLDENGRFLKVANMHYTVGQTVTNVIEMQVPEVQTQSAKKRNTRWIYSLAAMAACLVLVVTGVFQMGQATYGSVYMSINPEVRIDVNRRDIVVGLEGMNADGQQLIQEYAYQKKNLDLVMDELVDHAIAMGYLHEGGQITLTLDAEDNEWVVSRGGSLSAHLNEYLTEKITVTIEVAAADAAEPTPTPSVDQEAAPPTAPSDNYGASDYGEVTADELPSTSQTIVIDPGASIYDDGQTDYGVDSEDDSQPPDDERPGYLTPATDNGHSNYNDGRSDYQTPATDEGPSDYQEPASDDGQSDYQESATDDGQSDYQTPATDDGQSDYQEPATDDGQSDYQESSTDDGQSDYQESSTDDGQSDYQEPATDEGQSDYQEPAVDDGQSSYDDGQSSCDSDSDDD